MELGNDDWKIRYVQVVTTSSDVCPYGEIDKCHYPGIDDCNAETCPIKEWQGNNVDDDE